ncbi:hypothetical protein H6P81_021370 [Aristolochia fimbriata]|uniref:Uncharacterized protein n=1 Tax=Aristolochia fimbriata TaxID=158543 RepID=A0AAV7DR39_ARIFI|nr:hypothetical protein H6P81_021370 [Aristolochia fimbriata]
MSDSLVRVSRRVEWGPAGRRKSAQVPRGNASVVVAPPSSVTETTYPRAGSSARAWVAPVTRVGRRPESSGGPALAVPRSTTGASPGPHPLPSRQFQALFDSLFKVLFIFPSRLGPEFTALFGLHSQTTRLRRQRLAVRRGRAQRGCHPLWRPIPWDLRPVRRMKGGFCELQLSGEAARFSYWALRLARPLLGESFGCSHLTWGANPSKASGPRRQLPAGVLFRARASDHDDPRAAGGQGRGGATTRRAKCPWGKVFSANLAGGARATNLLAPATPRTASGWGSRAGVGGLRRAWRPGRCTLDLVASGATCVQRLRWFAGFCNSHQVSHFRFVLHRSREPRYPLPRVVLGYRVEIAPEWWLFVCSRPGPSRALAETRRRRVAKARRGFGGRFAPGRARPSPSGGIVCSFVKQVALRFVESTMILPAGSPHGNLIRLLLPLNDKVQWTFIALSANRQRRPAIEHFTDHSIGRAAGAELTRQIAPPTKSGHAPPPIESRKSSQSVNPYYVWTCTEAATRPVKARGASPGRRGESTCAHPWPDRSTNPRSNYELFNCNNLNIAIGAGITAAAGTDLPSMDPR